MEVGNFVFIFSGHISVVVAIGGRSLVFLPVFLPVFFLPVFFLPPDFFALTFDPELVNGLERSEETESVMMGVGGNEGVLGRLGITSVYEAGNQPATPFTVVCHHTPRPSVLCTSYSWPSTMLIWLSEPAAKLAMALHLKGVGGSSAIIFWYW